jgi:hypothetical protein
MSDFINTTNEPGGIYGSMLALLTIRRPTLPVISSAKKIRKHKIAMPAIAAKNLSLVGEVDQKFLTLLHLFFANATKLSELRRFRCNKFDSSPHS